MSLSHTHACVCIYMCVCMKKDNFKALMGIIGTQGPTLALRGSFPLIPFHLIPAHQVTGPFPPCHCILLGKRQWQGAVRSPAQPGLSRSGKGLGAGAREEAGRGCSWERYLHRVGHD